MQLQFQKQEISCLQNCLSQVQNLEQTQELRIPEGMPGAEQILGCWGQSLIRSKEWRSDSVRLTGGVQVWLLYCPEDGTVPRQMETWIPFQMDWDLPEGTREGTIRVRSLLRYCDARSVSAGKVLIRVGLGLWAEGWCPRHEMVFRPESTPEDVELLREIRPVLLPREAGEKAFAMEDDLSLPASAPQPEALVYYRMVPEVGERKVLGNKLVFRGTGRIHLLYRSEEGQLHAWDFEQPFSQVAELETGYSSDAQADVQTELTALELGLDEEGKLHLRAALTGQYLVGDRQMLETVSDAYSPFRDIQVQREELLLPALLDSRRENIYGEQTISAAADAVADSLFLPDFPRIRRDGDSVTLEQPGMIQLLYYDSGSQLQGVNQRLSGNLSLKAHETARITALPMEPQLQVQEGGDRLIIKTQVPVQLHWVSAEGMNMVTGLELGERKVQEGNRPSLILRRAGTDSLWQIARETGSTMAAIRQANALQGEPESDKMLLIPVI